MRAAQRSAAGDPCRVAPSELLALLSAEPALRKPPGGSNTGGVDAAPYYLAAVDAQLQQLGPGTDGTVGLKELAAALTRGGGSRALLCPRIPKEADDPGWPFPTTQNNTPNTTTAADAAAPEPRVVGPGCPCSIVDGAPAFRCPAGYRCSRAAYLGTSLDYVSPGGGDTTWARLQGACVPCLPGQYCAEGTAVVRADSKADDVPVAEPDELLASLDCPAGFFCPTPAEVHGCPSGAYCPARSTAPTSCTVPS
ncbi:hypothetical protein GPECTOR_584g644 [Gonium pectorale]|uniref:Uncharacterized protein n=1 Tax=Gonium pectorale TaxID=33097 RepID=A0A150FUJ0_GONPE|nr:hypothetical protein GPECTOR_584g644 [Gonium pectorale]|eukprot:KXZ41277.1 hypothetical protein GPECTOR_584g644 [Gonium pectorale]